MIKNKLSRENLFTILAALFCGCLLISNILASKTFLIGPVMLPSAVLIFPIVYIINDVLAEVFGFKRARLVIIMGFAINLLAVIFYNVAILLPAGMPEVGEAFKIVLGSSLRILIASFVAYLIGTLLNSFVMAKMKEKGNKKHLMLRCVVSTLVGEGLDAIIFISIAFAGILPASVLFTMIAAQASFKVVYEVIVYPLTKVVIRKAEAIQE